MGNLQSPANSKKSQATPKKNFVEAASCAESRLLDDIPTTLEKDLDEQRSHQKHAISESLEDYRACPGNCGFRVTWHKTHCCNMCSRSSGAHGKRCDRIRIREYAEASIRSAAAEEAETLAGCEHSRAVSAATAPSAAESERRLTEGNGSQSEATLLEHVTKLLAMLESKSTPPASALIRLQELRSSNPEDFPEVLGRCIDMVLSCTGPHLDATILDVAFDVIVASCEGAKMQDGASLVMYVFCWLVLRLGDSEGDQAPRNKYARCYGTRLLGRLYPVAAHEAMNEGWPSGAHEGCEAVLLRLSNDRAPAVRLASVAGLSAMETRAAQAALVRLSMVDSAVSIRLAALKGVVEHICSQSSDVANLFVNRSLDAAPSVRRCLYKRLGFEGSKISDDTFVDLLQHGMHDVNASVRQAAEEMLCRWLHQERDSRRDSTSPLLRLMVLIQVEQNSKLAEIVIQYVACKDEWRDILQSIAREPPADHELYRSERALIWRTMVMFPDGGAARYVSDFGLDPIFLQIERSLARKSTFELRQLLLVLAAAGPRVHGDISCNSLGRCRLFELAVSVLLRSPLDFDVTAERPSVQCLALVILQNALKGCSHVCTSTAKAAHLDARFLIVVNAILSSLQSSGTDPLLVVQKFAVMNDCEGKQRHAPASSPSTLHRDSTEGPSEADGLSVLGDRFDALASRRQSQAGNIDEELDSDLRETSRCLSAVTLRGLGIAEEALGLLSAANADERLVLLEDLPNIWLRPTLVRADSAEAVFGRECQTWPVLRAVAVRCLALHTSLCPELSASHWNFFLLVLKRYAPLLVSSRKDNCVESPNSSIVESCVHFLVDTQLVHRHVSDPSDVDTRAGELFEAVAGLLGLPARRMQLPQKFGRRLAERLCMLLLFGGVWGMDPNSNFGVDSISYSGGLDKIPQPARWVLTGLLVEAFFRPPPAIVATGRPAKALIAAAHESAQRGCLLQFFCALSDISSTHATLLAAACEGVLATELWRLAVPAQLGCGRRWCALQLPRLLRLLSRHLVSAAGQKGAPCMILQVWLECVWRPLALICLECKQDASARQLLAEALLAILAATEVAGEARSHFTAALDWPAAGAEISYVLSLILNSWGWHARGLARCDTAASDITVDASAATQNAENMKTPLMKLASRFCTRFADIEISETADAWQTLEIVARRRRENLREAFAKQGIDTTAIVRSATEVIRVRPSRAFLSGKQQRQRRASLALSTPRQKRRASVKGNKRRQLRQQKTTISDDDSDASGQRHDTMKVSPHQKRRRQTSRGGA